MDARRATFVSVAVALVAVAAVIAGRSHRRTREAEATLAGLARERAAMLAVTRTATPPAPTRAIPAETRTPAPSPPPAAAAVPAEAVPTPVALRRLRQDPELQALRLAADGARAEMNYAPLFRKLALSPEQRAAFLENVRRQREQKLDLDSVAYARLPEDSGGAVTTTRERIEQDYEKAQRTLLGAGGWEMAQEFEDGALVREEVAGLAGAAVLAGAPLSTAQAEELTRLIVANAREHGRKHGWIEIEAIDWEQVDARARDLLLEPQMALLKSLDSGIGRFSMALDRAVEAARRETPQRVPVGQYPGAPASSKTQRMDSVAR